MSYLTIAFPAGAAFLASQALFHAIRLLLGFALLAALTLIFKPLIGGLLRAALLLVAPRKSHIERVAHTRVNGAMALNRMARELDATQPGLAAELRNLATRD